MKNEEEKLNPKLPKEGDIVRVISMCKWKGQGGRVTKVEGTRVIVDFGDMSLLFYDHELEICL